MKKLFLFLMLCFALQANTQSKGVYQSIKKITNKTQQLVSVKNGQKIDTAAFRKLFLPTAHFTVVGKENEKQIHETMNLNDFLESLTDEYYSQGYFEVNQGQIIEEYNGIAQVIESFYGEDSDGVKGYGVNSYQLIYSNNRWWIANMIWTMSNDDGKDIPKKYFKN